MTASLPPPLSLMTFLGWLCENFAVTTSEPTQVDSEQTTCSSPEQDSECTRWGLEDVVSAWRVSRAQKPESPVIGPPLPQLRAESIRMISLAAVYLGSLSE